ncbi:MAG: hypothetical protein ACRBB6_16785 [Neptuniibacter sp.]
MSPLFEKIIIAIFLGILGVLTGMLAWWFLTPALSIPFSAFVLLSVVLGAIFFGFGVYDSDKAINALGAIWAFLWRLSSQVLKYILLFRK